MEVWYRVCAAFPMAKLPTVALDIVYPKVSHLGQLLLALSTAHPAPYAVSSLVSSFLVLWISAALSYQNLLDVTHDPPTSVYLWN